MNVKGKQELLQTFQGQTRPPDVPYATLPPAVQADEAVSQTSHKVLVVVSRAEHQVPVDRQDPQGVQQGHLLSDRLVGSTKLVEHRPVQTMVDCVERETLGPPLRLQEARIEKNKQTWEVRKMPKQGKSKIVLFAL